ncbi:unnamed protein product [Rotaria sp. Silwood1]|nr:unnamed protein product [Rotaria sp. Silwood1]CAF4955932.1 unnamed protein product [Rotaria sp. Silwood1]
MAARQLPQELILICLKFGITYRTIQIDKSNPNVLSELHQNAIDIVSKAIDSLDMNNYRHHIKLFLISPHHQPPSLKLIRRSNDLTPACFIEIIIWRSDQETFTPPLDHVLVEHNYKKPTYCSACDYFMWGLMKQGKRCTVCKRDFHHQCAEHLPADCPGTTTKRHLSLGRQSFTTTVSSMPQGQIFMDQDISSVSHTLQQRTRVEKLSNASISKDLSVTLKSPVISSSSTLPTSSKSIFTKENNDSQNFSVRNTNESSTPNFLTNDSCRTTRFQQDQNANLNTQSPMVAQRNFNPNQHRDIKLTNCHEKDGVWTATGQFDRESRHSKRAEISYDKKKFRFTQKDNQETTDAFEIPIADVEGYQSQLSSNSVANVTQLADKRLFTYNAIMTVTLKSFIEYRLEVFCVCAGVSTLR